MNKQDQEQVQTSIKAPAPKKDIQKSGSAGKIISILSLLFALAAAAAGWYLWQQLHNNQQQAHAQISQLQKDLSHANDLLTQQDQNLKKLQQESQALEQQNLENQSSHILLEVNYLTRLAAFHLMFENNTVLARQLLEAADQRLAANELPALWPLRQAFAKDIAMLNATPTVDLPGLMARLGSLNQQAEELPETPIPVAEKKTDETVAPLTNQPTLASSFLDKVKKFGYAVGHALSDMVIVSKDSKLVPSLLTAEQRLYVVTNIQSQLTLAQWAAVHRQQKIYQQSLLQVDTWLQRYFSADNALVKSMLKTVGDLKDVVINPETPTISLSLDALKKIKK